MRVTRRKPLCSHTKPHTHSLHQQQFFLLYLQDSAHWVLAGAGRTVAHGERYWEWKQRRQDVLVEKNLC